MKYARLNSDNTVIETYVPPTGVAITECFTPEIAQQFIQVSDEVEANWIKQSDGTFIAPPVELPPTE